MERVIAQPDDIRDGEGQGEGKAARSAWGLTERERDVLGLLAEGMSNKEIARRLLVTPNTVKLHVSRVLHKLGVQSRIEAALLWERRSR